MAYGKQRFMIDQQLTEANTTASSQSIGRIAGANKTGTGSASMTATGSYSGQKDLLYTVQIDELNGGEVGTSNFVQNPDFDSDTTGWTATNCTIASVAGGQSGNCLEITRVAAAASHATQLMTGLVIGSAYRFSAYVKSGTSGDETFTIAVKVPASTLVAVTGTSSGTWTKYEGTFTAESTSYLIFLQKVTPTAGTMLFDTAVVEIDASTFRWKTSDTAAGTWEATGVETASTPTDLSNGAQVLFTGGNGADFVLNDKWQFRAIATNGIGRLTLNDRDKFWKSADFETLITNGGFDSDTAGWTATDCTLASVAWRLEITRTGGAEQIADQDVTTVVGERYRVTAWVKSGTSGNEAYTIGVDGIGTTAGTSSGAWVKSTFTFTATGTTSTIELIKNTATAGTMLFDEAVILLIPSLELDLGSAVAIDTIIIGDHNLTSAATVTLYGNSSASWTSPPYDFDLLSSANSDPSVDYISETYQYWKYYFDDMDNPDGYISVGKMYHGTYTEFAQENGQINLGSEKTTQINRIRSQSESGKTRRRTLSQQELFTLAYLYLDMYGDADLTLLESVFAATYDIDTGTDTSIWVHYWLDTEAFCYLMECRSDDFSRTYRRGRKEASLDFIQEAMTRVI